MKKSTWLIAASVLTLLVVLMTTLASALLLTGSVDTAVLVLALGLQALLTVGAIWIATVFLELRLLRPLRQLQDHLGVVLHADADHRVELDQVHALGSLPAYVEEISRQLSRERRETTRAMETVAERIDHRKSRLEAILRDLHEGVVVCNDQHRIVLFNQSAAAILESAGPIGLHREIGSLLPSGEVQQEYLALRGRLDDSRDSLPLSRFDDRTADGRPMAFRMSLIVEPEGGCSGYVLSFSRDDEREQKDGPPTVQRRGVLSDRPEFYDFSLFEIQHEPDTLARPLEEVAYVVFDTETTGLSPSRGDELVQISGVRLVNGVATGEEFDTLVNPGMPIPPASIRFHGITDDMVVDAPDAVAASHAFRTFAEDAVLVAHNAAFDIKFLKLKESRGGAVFDNPVLDTLLVSYILQPEHSAHTLDAIAARFGISIADEVRHTALGDARATAEVFVRMLPVLRRSGFETLGQVLEASSRVFHIRREQENF